MTNEKLAALAQDPDNKELIPLLWDKVKDLLYMKANRAYRQHSDMFARCGVELADIRQSCYIVFLDALKGYQPDGETKFTSYLNYPFQTMLKELTHTRTSRKEPLNDATSLDKPIQDKDGDADATMVDLLHVTKCHTFQGRPCYKMRQNSPFAFSEKLEKLPKLRDFSGDAENRRVT